MRQQQPVAGRGCCCLKSNQIMLFAQWYNYVVTKMRVSFFSEMIWTCLYLIALLIVPMSKPPLLSRGVLQPMFHACEQFY